MSPFTQLGLPADADELSVKRAYAQRLRTTRPEGDPEGFQRLHAAYQSALEQCRRRVVQAANPALQPAVANIEPSVTQDPSNAVTSIRDVQPTPAPAPAPVLTADACCIEIIEKASTGDAANLQHWLARHPALWSMPFKAACGRTLIQRLYRLPAAMPAASIQTLVRFFDLDHALGTNHDAFAMQHMWRRIQLAWECQPEHRGELAARLGKENYSEKKLYERTLDQLTRPFSWLQVLLSGIDASKPARIARTVRQICGNDLEALPAVIQKEQLQFWLAAADRSRISKPRVVLGIARCIASILAAVAFGLLLGWLYRDGINGWIIEPLKLFTISTGIACSAWAAYMIWLPLNDWQARREELPARQPWLCLALVPLLCAVALTIEWLGFATTSLFFALATAWLMLCRYLRRNNGGLLGMNFRVAWVLLIILSQAFRAMKDSVQLSSATSSMPLFIVCVVTLMWSVDVWRQRKHLRVGRRRGARKVSAAP